MCMLAKAADHETFISKFPAVFTGPIKFEKCHYSHVMHDLLWKWASSEHLEKGLGKWSTIFVPQCNRVRHVFFILSTVFMFVYQGTCIGKQSEVNGE